MLCAMSSVVEVDKGCGGDRVTHTASVAAQAFGPPAADHSRKTSTAA
jgi:hypothetical protein